jgi:hypothetical protein
VTSARRSRRAGSSTRSLTGTYVLPVNGQAFPLVQVVTVAQLLAGQGPTMPATLLPYIAASRKQIAAPNYLTLDDG